MPYDPGYATPYFPQPRFVASPQRDIPENILSRGMSRSSLRMLDRLSRRQHHERCAALGESVARTYVSRIPVGNLTKRADGEISVKRDRFGACKKIKFRIR